MTRRKGEVSRADIMRKWPHHVALTRLRGIVNDEAVRGFADTLSVAPRPYHLRRGDADFVVFCFGKPEDAQAFAERFDGERLPMPQRSQHRWSRSENWNM